MWASPPCEEFSRWSLPWTRAKVDKLPSLELVQAALRLKEEAQPLVFILENVRGAQPWVEPLLGKPVLRRGSRYLWGDVLLAPAVTGYYKSKLSGKRKDLRSEVPFPLSYGIAMALRQGWASTPATCP